MARCPRRHTLPGDKFGVFNSSLNPDNSISIRGAADRSKNNNHEGVYIDDFVIGFASRGEMVTGNYDPDPEADGDPLIGDSPFTALPTNTDFTAPPRILNGNFQLNIRRGTEYGATLSGGTPYIDLYQTLDVNDRLTNAFSMVALPGSQIVDGQNFSITTLTAAKTFRVRLRQWRDQRQHRDHDRRQRYGRSRGGEDSRRDQSCRQLRV